MSEPTPTNEPTPPANAPNKPVVAPPRKKRRFLWLKVIGALILVLILLVIFAPAIASTGLVRSFVVGKVNAQLNGTLTIQDWSIGWGSGIEADGVKIVRDGKTLVDIPKVRTDLSLLDAMKGNFNLGQVPIEFHVNLVRDANGELNLAQLMKKDNAPATSNTSYGDAAAGPVASSKVPNVSGTFIIQNNSGITYTQEGMADVLNVGVSGQIKIADLNKPIEDTLEIPVQLGNGPAGKISLAGKVLIMQNNVVAIDKATADQTLKLENISLASLLPLLPPSTKITTLSGDTNGQVVVQLTAGTDAKASLNLTSDNFAFGGPVLKGDVYKSNHVTIAAPSINVALPQGIADVDAAHISIMPQNGGGALLVTTQQGKLSAAVDASLAALTNVAKNLKPGDDGSVNLQADFDLAPLATMLRKTMQLRDDVELRQAKFSNTTTITMSPADAKIHQDLKLQNVVVQNVKKNQPVKFGDIVLTADVTNAGGGAALPDLRDIAINLQSDFATADIKGRNLWDLAGDLKGTLDAVQKEAGQIVDFKNLDMSGAFSVNLASTGDLSQENGSARTQLTANVSDLRVSGIGTLPPLNQPSIQLSVLGNVLRGKQTFVSEVRDLDLHLTTGADQTRSIDFEAVANLARPDTTVDENLAGQISATYEIKRANIDLTHLTNEFAPLVQKYLKDLKVTQGTIAMTGKGAYSADQISLQEAHVQLADVSMQNLKSTPVPTDVLQRLSAAADLDGRVIMQNGGQDIRITNLKFTLGDVNAKDLITLSKDNPGREMYARFTKDGGFAAEGKLQMGASLGWLNQILDRFNAGKIQVAAGGAAPAEIRSGYLSGALDIVPSNDAKHPGTSLAVNYKIANLTVGNGKSSVLQGETVGIDGYAVAAPDMSGVFAQNLNVASRFANVRATDIVLKLKNALPTEPVSVFDLVQSGKVTADVPDAKQLGALLNSISPPAAGPGAAATAAAPLPPLVINSGKLNAAVEISHEGPTLVLNVPTVSGDGIAFTRGSASYKAQPFKVALQARLATATAPGIGAVPAVAYITGVDIPTLSGALGVADIALDKPIALKNLGSLTFAMMAPKDDQRTIKSDPIAADGEIKITGQIDSILALVNALGGDASKPALSGALTATQSFSTQGAALATSGTIDIAKFKAVGTSGTFAEDLVRLANHISVDPNAKILSIDDVSLDMQSSQALSLSIKNGKIEKYDTDRAINIAAIVKYDTGKLLQIVRPLMSPDMQQKLASAKVQQGTNTETYTINGTYPAGKPFAQAIKGLTAKGDVVLPEIDATAGLGADVSYLELPVSLQNGIVSTGFAAQTQGQPYRPNAMLNGGVVNLGNLDIDLTDPRMPVTSKAEKEYFLIRNVKVNPLFADTFLAKLVPTMFKDASKANGLVEVMVVKLDHLSLAQFYEDKNTVVKWSSAAGTSSAAAAGGDETAFDQWKKNKEAAAPPAIKPAAATGLGYAELMFSMTDVEIGNPLISGLINGFHANALNSDSFKGSIKNSKIILNNGQVSNDVTLAVGKYPLSFKGGFNLVSGALNPGITANIPSGLFGLSGKNAPEFFSLPIKGTIEHQEYDIGKLVLQAGFQTGLDSLIGGKKDDKNKNNAGGDNSNNGDNPLGGLLDQLGKDKKKNK